MEFKMITQMQKNMIANFCDNTDMLFNVYVIALQIGDFDTADYILDQGYVEKFSGEQMAAIYALAIDMAEAAGEDPAELEAELQAAATVH
jgi:hypothetical protein